MGGERPTHLARMGPAAGALRPRARDSIRAATLSPDSISSSLTRNSRAKAPRAIEAERPRASAAYGREDHARLARMPDRLGLARASSSAFSTTPADRKNWRKNASPAPHRPRTSSSCPPFGRVRKRDRLGLALVAAGHVAPGFSPVKVRIGVSTLIRALAISHSAVCDERRSGEALPAV